MIRREMSPEKSFISMVTLFLQHTHGISSSLYPHLTKEHAHNQDAIAGGWRNGLLFDPVKKYGNYSYADVMLYPLAAALAQAADADTKIYLAMQVCCTPRYLRISHTLHVCALLWLLGATSKCEDAPGSPQML